MECFAHPEVPAVGICCSCGKGVCRSCVQDLSFAIACSAVCAQECEINREVTRRDRKIYGMSNTTRQLPSGVIIWGLMAIFFTGFGIYQSLTNHKIEWFLLLFGAVLTAIAVLSYVRSRAIGLQC